jgi:hypothetical protein
LQISLRSCAISLALRPASWEDSAEDADRVDEAEAVFVRSVFGNDESWEVIFRDPAAGRPPIFTWSAPLE